jgi:hypothetical protein
MLWKTNKQKLKGREKVCSRSEILKENEMREAVFQYRTAAMCYLQ